MRDSSSSSLARASFSSVGEALSRGETGCDATLEKQRHTLRTRAKRAARDLDSRAAGNTHTRTRPRDKRPPALDAGRAPPRRARTDDAPFGAGDGGRSFDVDDCGFATSDARCTAMAWRVMLDRRAPVRKAVSRRVTAQRATTVVFFSPLRALPG